MGQSHVNRWERRIFQLFVIIFHKQLSTIILDTKKTTVVNNIPLFSSEIKKQNLKTFPFFFLVHNTSSSLILPVLHIQLAWLGYERLSSSWSRGTLLLWCAPASSGLHVNWRVGSLQQGSRLRDHWRREGSGRNEKGCEGKATAGWWRRGSAEGGGGTPNAQ